MDDPRWVHDLYQMASSINKFPKTTDPFFDRGNECVNYVCKYHLQET